MYSVANSLRDVQSAGSQFEQSISPYARASRPGTTGNVPDKSTIIWKDFLHAVKKRKGMLSRLREAALDSATPLTILKKLLLDIRQTTLALIEDALEIEYRARMSSSRHSKRSFKFGRLPPITSFKAMEDKEDIYALVEIIDDVDDLFTIPNIKVMLPMIFPNRRNPFMMGKTIDELAVSTPPHPEAGNVEEELKVLELLRFKRASRALLRAEAQVLNRLPIELGDLERLLDRMTDDFNVEKMFRSVCTILDNDGPAQYEEANLTCLLSPVFNVEAHDLLLRLNHFKGAQPMRIDVQVAIRQRLRECSFDYLDDAVSRFLLEWMELVLNATAAESRTGSSSEFRVASQSRGKMSNLESIVEHPGEFAREGSPQGRLPSRGVARAVTPQDFDRTHENITVVEPPLRKTGSPGQKTRPRSQPSLLVATPMTSMAIETQTQAIEASTSTSPTKPSSAGKDAPSMRRPLKRKAAPKEAPPQEVMSEFNSMASAPPAVIRKKIRMEVEKAMRDLGVLKMADEEGRGSDSNVSSIRYELQRLQQELLRRQVLDPKHYAIASVDAVAHAQQGLTVAGVNAFDPFTKRRKGGIEDESLAAMPLLIGEKDLEVPGRDGEPLRVSLTVVLNYEDECLLGTLSVALDDAYRHKLLDDYKPRPANMRQDQPTVLATVKFSKLVYSSLCDYTFDELVAAKPMHKPKMVAVVFDQLERIARRPLDALPRGLISADANRVLFSNKFSEDNVLVDLIISRNEACDGLSIFVTPIAGLFHAQKLGIGPIVIQLHDNELEVLLINQHSFFRQALAKWASMKLLTQWLATQIKIRKVAAAFYGQPAIVGKTLKPVATDGEAADSDAEAKEDEVSITSQITYTPRRTAFESAEIGGEVALERSTNALDRLSPDSLLLLEVTLNRRLALSPMLLEHWKARNLPKIVGLECVLEAVQDLEMLTISLQLTIPSKKAYKRLLSESARQETSQDLLDLDDFSDDDDQYGEAEDAPTKLQLAFQLTRPELLIFGYAAAIESKSIAMTRSVDQKNVENHPESLFWNVLIRLSVAFKGSEANPYKSKTPANDPANWALRFERQLLRDVRTISQNILTVTASSVGSELLLEPKHVNSSSKQKPVAPKRFSEAEIVDVVQTEGWPLKWMGYDKRRDLANALLDKLKVVVEGDVPRLELLSYVETKMLTVTRLATGDDFEQELGSVEINNQHTLSDLRILIKHELDPDELPGQFRFLYKGVVCSIRQEAFRRAWECLPNCFITPKIVESSEMGVETDDIAQKRLLQKAPPKKEESAFKMARGQRRVPGKYNPVPLPTLCSVHEGRAEVYLLHDGKELLMPGDIVRIGSVLGRDYLVSAVGARTDATSVDTRVVFLDPEYDLIHEPDFNLPIQGNSPWPSKHCGVFFDDFVRPMRLIKTVQELGVDYALPDEYAAQIQVTNTWLERFQALDPVAATATAPGAGGADDRSLASQSNGSLKKNRKAIGLQRAFKDCWVWKCVPAKDDMRPKWRQMYDDGLVTYSYEMRHSDETATHFRVKARLAYLEVLCTDARVPALSAHQQRVNHMRDIPLDFYLRTAFERMTTDWTPVYKKGVERAKFIKLMREVAAFPDLKRPARVAQLDMLFQKVVKTADYGIVQKYISYQGFCQLLKDVALLRFPPKRKKGSNADDDNSSIGSVGRAAGKRGKDDDDSSLMTDDMSSVGDDGGASGALKRVPSKASLARKPSAAQLTKSQSTVSRKSSVTTKSGAKDAPGRLKLIEEEPASGPDPEHLVFAYQKFVLDFVMMYPGWYDAPWREAKMAAMRKEAVPYCAATRIAAIARGFVRRTQFRNFLRQHVKLQANIRRQLSARRTRAVQRLLREDWCFRLRYYYATRINAWVRRFLKRCWYMHVLEQIKRQQIVVLKARRQRLKKLRVAARKAIIYSEAVRVNGVMVFITLTRKDPRNYTKDFGVKIEVYAPVSQTTFHFTLEDAELRAYMAIELELDVVTVGQIMDIRNLKRLMSSRLIVHKGSGLKSSAPLVLLSKHALGQRGERALVRAKRIQGHMFVCKIFETVDDLAVQCYHTISCKIFTCKMGMKEMRAWVTEEHRIECKDELARFDDPPLLNAKHKKAFHAWVLDHLAIDTRHGQFRVLFSCHLARSKKGEMIVKIQAAWRRALVRPIIIRLLDAVLLKVFSSPGDHEAAYYLNRLTGASSWEKSKLLGRFDLPTQPISHWVTITYYDEQGQPRPHYVNPYTGKYTHLVPERAARMIQAVARNHLLKTIAMPLSHFLKAGAIYRSAEAKYTQRNGGGQVKLSAVVNLALVRHVVELEEEQAKELYRQAVDLSEANPLVTRAYAFFLLGTVPAPLALNRERALVLLRDGERKDPDAGSFRTTYFVFQFAVLRRPEDVRTLLNLALVQCYLYADTKSFVAEKLLRRALALAPFDERVMEIWRLLRDRFPERQLLYSSMMRRTSAALDVKLERRKTVHGRQCVENRQWAGWLYVEKDTLNVSKKFGALKRPYWYNPATGEERDTDPDFAAEWEARRARSLLQESTGTFGLESYYDPLTLDYFEYFALTHTYQ